MCWCLFLHCAQWSLLRQLFLLWVASPIISISVHVAGKDILRTFWLWCHMPVNMCIWMSVCLCMCVCVCVPTPRVHPSLKMDSVYACILACDKYCCSEHRCVGVFSDDISSICRVPALQRQDTVVAPVYFLKEAPCCSVSWLFPVDTTKSKCVTV